MITLKNKKITIHYLLDDSTEGTVDDLNKLSKTELLKQIHLIIDEYSWLLKPLISNDIIQGYNIHNSNNPKIDFLSYIKLTHNNSNFCVNHIKVLKEYTTIYFNENKKVNALKFLEHLFDDHIKILFSYNFDKNDFSQHSCFQDYIKHLASHKMLNPTNHYENISTTWDLIEKHCDSKSFLNFSNSNISNIDSLLYANLQHMFHSYLIYINDDLDNLFSKSIDDPVIQEIFTYRRKTSRTGVHKQTANIFILRFYEYLNTLDDADVFKYFPKILRFLSYFDNENLIKRTGFAELLVRFAKNNSVETISILLHETETYFSQIKFDFIKKILNDNCVDYKLSNLYTITQRPKIFYDIDFLKTNTHIIFNKIDIEFFATLNMHLVRLDENTLRLRLVMDKEISLPPNEVIDILQESLSTYPKKHNQKINMTDQRAAVDQALRLISIRDALNSSSALKNGKENVKKKL